MMFGQIVIKIGLAVVLLELLISYAPWLISWFGKLPGDVRIEDKNGIVFIPITSMLIASILLTVLVNIFFRK
ncbi:MAG: hypothetical protein CTY29_11130 [Methylobacter sp.]|nr:MAG: hypothetical protein CTY29_11130 [Methylobacter sp.]